MIKITFPDGASRSYKIDITPYEIASSISEGLARNVISASFNDQTIETSTKLKENGKLIFYTWKDQEGKKAFWHSSAHVLAQVLEEFYTDIKLTIGPAISNGFYYDVDFGKHILSEKDFPIKLTGYTPCFRREAGSYGAHVRGLNRVHQFDKVEIVRIEHPDKSYDALKDMIKHVEGLLEKLELPYRILRLCGGDLGFTSALTFDFEVYSAAQKRWLEVSSVSNFETFQTNRLKLRFKDENGKSHLAHSLNGSALALARIMAALLENNQSAEGIKIPKALQAYTRFEMIK